MAIISNGNLSITREGNVNTVHVTFDIEWNDEELRLSNVPFFAELAFRGDDGGLRGSDDRLFTQLIELTGRDDFSNLRPESFDEIFEFDRDGPFSLDEDKGWGLTRRARRRRDTDEIFVRIRLIPSSLTESNQLRTNNVSGRF